MSSSSLSLASPAPAPSKSAPGPGGSFCHAFGCRCYRIDHVQRLPPFLINLVSATDLWMFVASNGALSAGRTDADGALFPYQTVDRIYDSAGQIGPVTQFAVDTPAGEILWEPFSPQCNHLPVVDRRLYKSIEGDRLWFEETRSDLGLTFHYGWSSADSHGFIRRCGLRNLRGDPCRVRLLDGLRNLLPAGVSQRLQGSSSYLADAYKTAELLPGSTCAVYALASAIIDRPEPIEALRAAAVWSLGLPGATLLLSDDQLDRFRAGVPLQPESQTRGRRGAYLQAATVDLRPGQTVAWCQVADTGLSQAEVVARRCLSQADGADATMAGAEAEATHRLRQLVGAADGCQASGDEAAVVHHFANVLFNTMRGGTFVDGHTLPAADFVAHVGRHNREVAVRHAALLARLPDRLTRAELLARVSSTDDPDLRRLAAEYLPLLFSRRHGDPSRPWNRFSIRLRDDTGRRLLAYEGNWRDIFQNWEALCLSYPEFLAAVIAKFLNASTADGYNPYRISQAGIEWEVPDPEDPWSSIGYWGDHQVAYLLKLLEWSARLQPASLPALLRSPAFSYADVPYRIADYAALRRDPRNTITFDAARHRAITARLAGLGADARLVSARDGRVRHANLTEKLLILTLVRMTNFIPGGGIWMNTQRPEWNDANNALVGYGVSVVTLGYLRRLLQHVRSTLWPALDSEPVPISAAVAELAGAVSRILQTHRSLLANDGFEAADRRRLADALAAAGAAYRARIYADDWGEPAMLAPAGLTTLFDDALAFVDHSLRANRRPDRLFHAYNQLEFTENPPGLELHRLPLMLEGQVAVLSSGLLPPEEVIGLLRALRRSALHRSDLHSYLLYPDRTLPGFLGRNIIPPDAWAGCRMFAALEAAGDQRLVARDADGRHRFHPDLVNVQALDLVLARLETEAAWAGLVAAEAPQVRLLYEKVFRHRAFTGRSGSMFGFEGLGCIYWHMVAKLLLAVQEALLAAQAAGSPAVCDLIACYYDVRAGLGFNHTPADFGAFPTDPYSHTPGYAGAQQPGMTGQVKEEILTRLGELGVCYADGRITFRPTFLRAREFCAQPVDFRYIGSDGQEQVIRLPTGSLGFTLAGVPTTYHLTTGANRYRINRTDGSCEDHESAVVRLSPECSRAVLQRTGQIRHIEVWLGTGFNPVE